MIEKIFITACLFSLSFFILEVLAVSIQGRNSGSTGEITVADNIFCSGFLLSLTLALVSGFIYAIERIWI